MSNDSFKSNKINIDSTTSASITIPENGDIIVDAGILKIYNSSVSSWERLCIFDGNEVLYRNQEDFSGQVSATLIPQFEFNATDFLSTSNFSGGDAAGSVNSIAWSPNGEYLALGVSNSPFINIYQRNGNKFVKLTNPGTLPASKVNKCSWSPNGEFLAVVHATTPFVTIYQRSGSTFTKLANPATLPTGGTGCSWSSNGEFLAVSGITSPFITIYQRSGTTFTKLTDPGTLPTGVTTDCKFSNDGIFLSVTHNASPYITIYRRSGTTFTKVTNPTFLPSQVANSCAWSPNSDLLCVTTGTTGTIQSIVYKYANSIFTKLIELPSYNAIDCSFSANGRYLSIVSSLSANYVDIYSVDFTNTFPTTYFSMPYPVDVCNCSTWSPNGEFFVVGLPTVLGSYGNYLFMIYQTINDISENRLTFINKIKRSGT